MDSIQWAKTAGGIKLIMNNAYITFAGTNLTISCFSLNESIGIYTEKILFWVNGRK